MDPLWWLNRRETRRQRTDPQLNGKYTQYYSIFQSNRRIHNRCKILLDSQCPLIQKYIYIYSPGSPDPGPGSNLQSIPSLFEPHAIKAAIFFSELRFVTHIRMKNLVPYISIKKKKLTFKSVIYRVTLTINSNHLRHFLTVQHFTLNSNPYAQQLTVDSKPIGIFIRSRVSSLDSSPNALLHEWNDDFSNLSKHHTLVLVESFFHCAIGIDMLYSVTFSLLSLVPRVLI